MACDCIARVDADLAGLNARLAITFAFGRDGAPGGTWPYLATEKLDPAKRGRPPVMVPTFCPFCGVAYAPQPARPAP